MSAPVKSIAATTVGVDLERLRGLVETNWSNHNCALLCMNDMWREDGADWQSDDAFERKHAMYRALGFRTPDAMYDWNDQDGRTKQEVLDRIDDALEALN